MANSLTGSVGENGNNRPDDVQAVYILLNKILPTPLPVSDQVTGTLIQAIRDFQQGFMTHPDGRIDVSGGTWKQLVEAAG